jgi:putative transposase
MPAIVVPGVPLHVTQLGAARERLFSQPQDYATYLLDLGEAAAVFGCAVHAYVLMPDHVQLLLTPAEPDGPLRLIQALVRCYDEYLGRRYARRGTIGENDLRVAVLHSDREVLACCRHIELDPVRAGTVSEPVAYRWSSFRANGLGARDAVLTPHPAYLALAPTGAERRRAYRALFERRLDAEVERLLRQRSRLGVSLRPAEASSG